MRPKKGTACVFYTRSADGDIDAASFHFGAAVRTAGVEKWTCQAFKALPEAARTGSAERRAFLSRVHPTGGDGGGNVGDFESHSSAEPTADVPPQLS